MKLSPIKHTQKFMAIYEKRFQSLKKNQTAKKG